MSSAMRSVGVALPVTLITSLAACTLLVPYDRVQCSTAADCRGRGPAFANSECVSNVCTAAPQVDLTGVPDGASGSDVATGPSGPWDCVSQPSAPTDPNRQVDVQLVIFDSLRPFTYSGSVDGGDDLTFSSYTPLPGVSVVACIPDDPSCLAPQSPVAVTDDSGAAWMTVPGNFTGFYYLTKPDFMPELLFPAAHLLASDTSVHYPATVLSNATVGSLSSALGINSQDAGPDGGALGLVLVTQFDCTDHHAANVSITTTPAGAMTIYTTNGLPSNGLTATSADGEAAVIGVPTGAATITATLQGTNPQVVANSSVIVRPGTMTWVLMRPRTR